MSTTTFPTVNTRVIRVRPAPPTAAEAAAIAALGTTGVQAALGGGARAGAGAALVQHARDDGGLRPSVRLRLAIGSPDYRAVQAEHDRALEAWMREALQGCQLVRPKPAWLQAGASLVTGAVGLGKKLSSIEGDLKTEMATNDGSNTALAASVRSGSAAASDTSERAVGIALSRALATIPTPELFGEAMTEITAAVTDLVGSMVEDVAGAVAEVLEFIPGVGIITSALKAIKCTVMMVVSAIKRRSYTKVVDSSISVIEREAMWSADWFEERQQASEGRGLASAVLTGTAHSLGYLGAAAGPVAKAATSVINLTARIIQLVRDVLAVRSANKSLLEGSMTVAKLRDTPVLGLCLPHLPGAHALSTLGIVAPGWKATDHAEQAERLRKVLSDPRNRTIRTALDAIGPQLGGAAAAAGTQPLANPWQWELERLKFVYDETHRHAHDFPWLVMRGDKQVYAPLAISMTQRAKQLGKDTAKAAWTRLRALPADVGLTAPAAPAPTGASPPTASPPTTSPPTGPAPSSGSGAAVTTVEETERGWQHAEWVLEDVDDDPTGSP